MSGDVQPRKRKDKKKKKDDLGVEEPRGTAAVLGEGDVFIHSHHDHGTGGHWCAKIIFFSLLAVLVTLIGLIILENRGLTELEANAVESRYSGVLEGWLEEAPEDDHHDEHTLELKHHDDDDDDHTDENDLGEDDDDNNNNDEHDEDDNSDIDNDDADHNDNEEDQQDDEDSQEQDLDTADDEDSQEQDLDTADDEDENEKHIFSKYFGHDDDDDDNDDQTDNDDDDQHQPDEDNDEADENNTEEDADNNDEQDDNNLSKDLTDNDEADDKSLEDTNNNESNDWENSHERDDEDEDEQEEQEDELDVEVERIEREDSEEETVSTELPALPETDDDSADVENIPKVDPLEELDDETDEFLENDDEEPPIVEHVSAPAGQPFTEVEDVSTERPSDTLADEEEYEKRQEELRREREQASHMWLKLVVGGALLVATHAVVRRATAPRDVPTVEEHIHREETPTLSDRRMTLIPEEPSTPVLSKRPQEWSPATIEEEVIDKTSFITTSAPSPHQESDEEEEQEDEEEPIVDEAGQPTVQSKATDDKELYSDEDEAGDDEVVEVKKEIPKSTPAVKNESIREPEHEDEVPDDVEIIEDEQLEEELEEEEEDISDVDDVELLTRLEAKYGRLPEPERPEREHKDGGNRIDEWPGEPSDAYWRQELDRAEQELRQGKWTQAAERAQAAGLDGSGRARWIAAVATDRAAEAHRDNRLLTRAIAAYLRLLEMNERLSDNKLIEIANRTLDRIQFRGNYLAAEPVYRLLIRRFPDDIAFRNNLSVTFLMANRADLAGEILKETLKRWPNDRIALAHYGFVLKTHYNQLTEAVDYFQRALEDDIGPATEPRFYYHLGDSLLLLGRHTEAHEVHKRAAAHGHFLSAAQRSLYNVPRLRSRPWWNIEDTPYVKLARTLEKSWREILKEGEAAQALYEQEKEGLRERGEWSQLDLFVRGKEIPGRCAAAPVTCAAVRREPAAAGCRRGQIKFSAMAAGTHVRPHVGPTNCRLRMHLGLTNTKDTYIRVDRETRQWQVGKTFLFDDSFEHEVWHNGTGTRLVLIVDVWHPDLTRAERRSLPAI